VETRPDPGDGDRENVLILNRALYRLHRRIEALDMADHQRDACALRRGDDGAAFLDVEAIGFSTIHGMPRRGAGDRNIAMQMRRRGRS